MNLLSFLIGFLSLIVHVIFVPLLIRLLRKSGAITIHILSGVSVHLITVMIFVVGFNGVPYWPLSAIYWLGFMVYWYVFGSFYTSMTLKTLRMLNSNSTKSCKLDEIFKTCFEYTFVERVQSLGSLGLAIIINNEIHISDKGKKISRFIQLFNIIFGIDSNGLYLIEKE